jgi:hypothetical protein
MQPGWGVLVLLLLSVFVSATPARAAENADELLRDGIALRRAGRNEEALPKFERAYRLAPSPRAIAQVGLCKQALGLWADAEEALDEALRAPPDQWMSKNRPAIEQALITAREHIGRVEVVGEPAGAEVLVAGRLRGKLPLPAPVHVNAGTVDIEVRSDAYESVLRTVTVAPAGFQTVVVHLHAKNEGGGAVAGDLGRVPPPPVSSGQPPPLVAKPDGAGTSDEAAPRPLWKRGWFWGAVGAVVVGGVVTAVLLNRGTVYPSSTVSGSFP